MSSIGKIRRLLTLLERLQSGRMHNAGELAEFCGVSRRTIFRDLKTLQDSGIALLYDASRHGYWIADGAYLPPTDLTLTETISLIQLLEGLDNADGPGIPFQQSARDAAQKLRSNLPGHLREYVGELAAQTTIQLERQVPATKAQEDYERMLEAVQQRLKVRLQYDSLYDGKEINTLLSPYTLLFQRRGWYVIGRSSLHRAVRTFLVARIQRSELTSDHFERPPRFTLKRYLGQAWSMIRERGERCQVVVRFQPLVAQNVAQVTWHSTQKLVWNADGTLDFHVEVDGINEISWWIMGYGDKARVLQPQPLVDLIRNRLQTMCESYDVPLETPPSKN